MGLRAQGIKGVNRPENKGFRRTGTPARLPELTGKSARPTFSATNRTLKALASEPVDTGWDRGSRRLRRAIVPIFETRHNGD